MDAEKLRLVAEWVERGARSLPHTYANVQELTEVTERLFEWIETRREKEPKWFAAAEKLLQHPGPLYFELFCARWAASGYPLVVVERDLADALLRADVDAVVLERVRPRWPAFLVELPEGLLRMHGTPESPPAHFLAVFHDPQIVAMSLRSTEVREIVGMQGRKLASHLAGIDKIVDAEVLTLVPAEGGTRDAMARAWKLGIGVEMELADPSWFAMSSVEAPNLKGAKTPPRMILVELTRRVH